MKTRVIEAKDLKASDIVVFSDNTTRLIKYVDVGPKTVYAKSLSGKQMSFMNTQKLEVV